MKILFIGNSYTYFNGLPETFEALARENGRECEALSVTKGGRHLYENLSGDETAKSLDEILEKYKIDTLVLQEQSYFALVDEDRFSSAIGELINKVAPKRTVLYATWGRCEGAPLLAERGWSSSCMTDMLYSAYRRASERYECELCPVGLCFREVTEGGDVPYLYHPDKSHPSKIGTALAALCHYAVIFGDIPTNLTSLGIDEVYYAPLISAVKKYCNL
ncbi:MAG: hypothetical protein J6L90_00645 [Clostridia bacterium]|nr:hypothetical protein [Clostridia bacterium]